VEYQRGGRAGKSIGPDAVSSRSRANRRAQPATSTGRFRQEDNLLTSPASPTGDDPRPASRRSERSEVIFSRDRDPSNERWTGKFDHDEVTAETGVRDGASPPRSPGSRPLFQGAHVGEPGQRSYVAPRDAGVSRIGAHGRADGCWSCTIARARQRATRDAAIRRRTAPPVPPPTPGSATRHRCWLAMREIKSQRN